MTTSNQRGVNCQLDLRERTAIVTGGAGSLGRAISLCLRNNGCHVVVLDRDDSGLAVFASEPGITCVRCDLVDPAKTELCLHDVWHRFGPVSILVNAVGYIYSAPLVNLASSSNRRHSFDAWQRVIDANLTAVFLATVNTVERMASTRTQGVVINFSSVAAAGNAGQSAYSAAKAAVNAMTLAWAKELGPLGIRFVALAPGFIDTPTTQAALSDSMIKEWIRRTPLRRLGSIDDVVSAVLFAIANEHITGKVIEIDGGLTL